MTLRYDPPTVTGGGLWAGTTLLRSRLRVLFPDAPINGGYNPRCVQNHRTFPGQARCEFGHRISHHAEARALDLMTLDSALHRRIVAWCLSAEGQSWGVQEIITGYGPQNRPQRWQAGIGWRDYSGPSAHRDHVHLSQTIEAASRRVPPAPVPPPPINPPPPIPPTEDLEMASQDISMTTDDRGHGYVHVAVPFASALAVSPVIGHPASVAAALPGLEYVTATECSLAAVPNDPRFTAVVVSGYLPRSPITVRFVHAVS